MATIYIDNKPYNVDGEENLLQACLSLGLNLPYFCWHPALGSVGACRQCAVKQFRDEKDTRGRLVMACMTPASEGTRISLNDPEAREMRAGVIEWLMENHPHDCPVCDEGGECHLQDMTVMSGHNYRSYRFKKRTYRNQYLGPFINHEMNRCIQCYRCVRYYRDYAGGDDLNAFSIHNHTYFGRSQDGVLENEFSGNLVEICPTGVFTDKTLKQHYTRKWDMTFAPSVCHLCAVGCNISPAERYGTLRRVVNRYNGRVNRYFLCDRGRFGYEFVNHPNRIRQATIRTGENVEPLERQEAIRSAASRLSGGRAIGIGSPRASLEANYALRTMVGAENFFAGVAPREASLISMQVEILREGPARTPSASEIEQADAVLILGEDLTNVAPILALAVRQAVRNAPMKAAARLKISSWNDFAVRELVQGRKGPCFIATPQATRLDEVATGTYHGTPADIARLGYAVAHALDPASPAVQDASSDLRTLAGTIAEALQSASHPAIIAGPSCGSEAVIQAAANVARALGAAGRPADLCFTAPECNSVGLALLGAAGNLEAAFGVLERGEADTVIVLENDLYRRADAGRVTKFLESAKNLIVLDHNANPTTAKAAILLPCGTFAEQDGTLVSSEGRAQRFFEVYKPVGDVTESWRWLSQVMALSGLASGVAWKTLDEVIAAMGAELAVLEPVRDAAPSANLRLVGKKVPREPHRFSGRTAMLANINVSEPKPPDDPDSPLSFTMEGFPIANQPPAPLLPFFWSPGWNSIQSLNKFQEEVGGPLRGGDPGVRLIEPKQDSDRGYFTSVPARFEAPQDRWLLVPSYHIFGSEETSGLAPAIAERAPAAYIAVAAADGVKIGVDEGASVEIHLSETALRLPVRIDASLPSGVAALPVGLRGLTGVDLPAKAGISKVS